MFSGVELLKKKRMFTGVELLHTKRMFTEVELLQRERENDFRSRATPERERECFQE